jgi:hypothetical protein
VPALTQADLLSGKGGDRQWRQGRSGLNKVATGSSNMKKPLMNKIDHVGLVRALHQRGGNVSEIDARRLRREFATQEISRDAADALFAVEYLGGRKSPEWTEFFADAIVDHIVWQSRPTGIVNDAQAEWLIERADACKSMGALAVLVAVLTEAHSAPEWLASVVRDRAAAWPATKSIHWGSRSSSVVDLPC